MKTHKKSLNFVVMLLFVSLIANSVSFMTIAEGNRSISHNNFIVSSNQDTMSIDAIPTGYQYLRGVGEGQAYPKLLAIDIDEYIAEMRTNINRAIKGAHNDIPNMQSVIIKYLKTAMQDVNDLTNDELDKVKYRNDGKDWDKFCEEFNKLVASYGMPLTDDSGKDNEFTKIVHYFRNTLNRAPPTLAALKEEKDKWTFVSVIGTIYHMYGIDGEYNVKFTSKDDGKYEAVYNIAGNDWKNAPLLNEEEFTQTPLSTTSSYHNMATYNYGKSGLLSSIQDILPGIPNSDHDRLDVQPYKKWGNTEKDYPDDENTWLKCFHISAILRRNTFATWLYGRNSVIYRCPVGIGIAAFLHPFSSNR